MSNATIVRMDKKTWAARVGDYIIARATKKEADAASRAADTTIKALRGQIREAMGGNPTALCGNAVLTLKTTSAAEAALTLKDGSKLAWADVTAVVVGNRHIPRADVISLYGGRSASEDVECTGQP